jgi:hypothetical protein
MRRESESAKEKMQPRRLDLDSEDDNEDNNNDEEKDPRTRSGKAERHLDVVTSSSEDNGEEVREGVGRHGRAHEEETVRPETEVEGTLEHVAEGDLVGHSVATIRLNTVAHQGLLLRLEELGLVREVDCEWWSQVSMCDR